MGTWRLCPVFSFEPPAVERDDPSVRACGAILVVASFSLTMPTGGGSNKAQKEVVNKKKKKKDDDDDDDEGSQAQKNKMKEDAAKVKAMQDKIKGKK